MHIEDDMIYFDYWEDLATEAEMLSMDDEPYAALDIYDLLVIIFPEETRHYFHRALIHLELGDTVEVLKNLRIGVALNRKKSKEGVINQFHKEMTEWINQHT